LNSSNAVRYELLPINDPTSVFAAITVIACPPTEQVGCAAPPLSTNAIR
jgi:hypothetical protein